MIPEPRFLPKDPFFWVSYVGDPVPAKVCPTCQHHEFDRDQAMSWSWQISRGEIRFVNWTAEGWRYTDFSWHEMVAGSGWFKTLGEAYAEKARLEREQPNGPPEFRRL